MIAGLDRDAIARGRRRAQALEALEFERERERALRAQIEQLVVEADGPQIDAQAFSRLDPDDVELVRGVLAGAEFEGDDDVVFAEEDRDARSETQPADEEDPSELELARLQGAIEASRALQAALERYVAALDAGPELG
jgi:hypothetical protein